MIELRWQKLIQPIPLNGIPWVSVDDDPCVLQYRESGWIDNHTLGFKEEEWTDWKDVELEE